MGRIRIEASSIQELQARAPNINLQGGDSGRLEIYAPRFAGVCPVPLGNLMETPGVGHLFSSRMAPAGATVTRRGGIGSGVFDCDAYLEWSTPGTFAQGPPARMGAVVALVVVLGAIGLALVALGWAVSKLVLFVDTVDATIPGGGGLILILGAAALVMIGAKGFTKKRKR